MEKEIINIKCKCGEYTYKTITQFFEEYNSHMTDLIKIALLQYNENHKK